MLVLRNAREFKVVYERGAKRVSRSFVVFVLSNGLAESRFGLTTPRKLGKAHDRNRIRRRIREILRTAELPRGFDWVINPKHAALQGQFAELKTELLTLIGAAR